LDAPSDPPSNSHLRPVDLHQHRPPKRPSRVDRDPIPDVNPHLPEAILNAVPSLDGDDSCRRAGWEMVKGHEGLMITILNTMSSGRSLRYLLHL